MIVDNRVIFADELKWCDDQRLLVVSEKGIDRSLADRFLIDRSLVDRLPVDRSRTDPSLVDRLAPRAIPWGTKPAMPPR